MKVFRAPPPVRRSRPGRSPSSSRIVTESLSAKQMASKTARVMWARRWARLRPRNAPRAEASRCEVLSPGSYGRQGTPAAPGGPAAGQQEPPRPEPELVEDRDRVPERKADRLEDRAGHVGAPVGQAQPKERASRRGIAMRSPLAWKLRQTGDAGRPGGTRRRAAGAAPAGARARRGS